MSIWKQTIKNLSRFDSAVLSVVDTTGYPYTIRCKPIPDQARQVLIIGLSENIHIQPGSAGLLGHRHDEGLWKIESFLVIGLLSKERDAWILQPKKFTLGPSKGIRGNLRMVTTGRRRSRHYLKTRNLSLPKVPWNQIREVLTQSRKNQPESP